MTVPEAAFVTGVPAQDIDREIDAKVIRSSGTKGSRALSGGALVYIMAIVPLRTELAPSFRRRMCAAVVSAVTKGQDVAKVETLKVEIKAIQEAMLREFSELETLKKTFIESNPSILAGEPILRGTRIPVRLVADLVKKGTSRKEIGSDLELSSKQIDAAVTFDRITPRRGRPPIKRRKVTQHVPAD